MRIFTLFILIITVFSNNAKAQLLDENLFNCYTIVAGKNTTVDGSLMLGHNEDDWQEQMMNFYIVPARSYSSGELLEIERNATIPQPSFTAGYLWLQMLAQDYADVYLNEHGLALVSDRCASKEDRKDYTDGGIGYALRRVVAERAKTPQEAVAMIGELVEKYGYSSTGRSYIVANAQEAWMVSVVQGRHWVAQRVPDDQVVVIPNYYIIDKVNLSDRANFRGSKDLISYATERGWYNPETDGEFSFRKAYSDPATLNSSNNIGRSWGGLRLLAEKEYKMDQEFPFSFTPKEKIDVEDVILVLSDHFEGTDMDRVKMTSGKEPHDIRGSICNLGTQSSVVFQLRKNMPVEIGSLMWTAMYSPCRQVYIPWYLGIGRLPKNFGAMKDPIQALDSHFDVRKDFRKIYPNALYWKFLDYSNFIGQDYTRMMSHYNLVISDLQLDIFMNQKTFEQDVLKQYAKLTKERDPNRQKKIGEVLFDYGNKYHKKMIDIVESRYK